MPKTCCVTGCDVGKRTCQIRTSLFRFPSDPVERERWKRAIPRVETEKFRFDSPNTRVCALHFDATDIVRTDDFVVNTEVVSHDRIVPKLRAGAVPRIFPNCPSYLTTPKPRSRMRQTRVPGCPLNKDKRATKRQAACMVSQEKDSKFEPLCKIMRLHATGNVYLPCDQDKENGAQVEHNAHEVESSVAHVSCQTDDQICTKTELQKAKCKLWHAQAALRSLQRRLAQVKAECRKSHVSRKGYPNKASLPERQKVILDHCIKKVAAKSSKGMRYSV